MRYSKINLLVLMVPVLLVAGCQSKTESNVKQPETAQAETAQPGPQRETMAITGSAAQRAWIHRFTDAINVASDSYAHGDAMGAIQTADSLRLTCESVLDTLGQDDTQAQFLMVCVADLYGKLRQWKGAQGDQAGVAQLTKDYAELVRRMHDRQSAATSPDAP